VDPDGEKLYLRGNQAGLDFLRTQVLYEMVGGEETFNQYFRIENGQVLLNEGVDPSQANAGVQELAGIVGATENYVYFAGDDGQANAAAALFDSTLKKGEAKPLTADERAEVAGAFRDSGLVIGTSGRPGVLQPASLANSDPVFAVIAYNTSTTKSQVGIANFYGSVNELAAQASGYGQVVKPVSIFIHESAENRFFSKMAMSYRYGHPYAQNREAVIRKELGITGGFAGGSLDKTQPLSVVSPSRALGKLSRPR
jgi:hypothetical protein